MTLRSSAPGSAPRQRGTRAGPASAAAAPRLERRASARRSTTRTAGDPRPGEGRDEVGDVAGARRDDGEGARRHDREIARLERVERGHARPQDADPAHDRGRTPVAGSPPGTAPEPPARADVAGEIGRADRHGGREDRLADLAEGRHAAAPTRSGCGRRRDRRAAARTRARRRRSGRPARRSPARRPGAAGPTPAGAAGRT